MTLVTAERSACHVAFSLFLGLQRRRVLFLDQSGELAVDHPHERSGTALGGLQRGHPGFHQVAVVAGQVRVGVVEHHVARRSHEGVFQPVVEQLRATIRVVCPLECSVIPRPL